MSTNLFVRCLGVPAVFAGQDMARLSVPRSGLQLLLFLCVNPDRRVLRDEIVEELWPETAPEKAASRLTSALWRLRKALDAGGARDAVELLSDGALRLASDSQTRVDLRALEEAGEAFLAADGQLDLPAALVDDTRGASHAFQGWYAPWALRERVRLENLSERCLRTQLCRQMDAGRLDEAVGTAGRLLETDPLLEDIHEALIDIFIAQDRPGRAKRQFDCCASLLQEELGVAPSARVRDKVEEGGAVQPPRKDLAEIRRRLARSALRLSVTPDRVALRT